MARGRRYTTAVFFRRPTRELHPLVLPIPSGYSADKERARLASNDYAFDNDYTHWAQWDRYTTAPDAAGPGKTVEQWIIFECRGRAAATRLHSTPTQASAEMWLVHHV